jgi:hypothetical protein
MIGIKEEIPFYTLGKEGVIARLKLLHGEKSIVIKGKHILAQSACSLIGHVLTPDQFSIIFGEGVYPDWGGEENTLHVPAKLISVESNKASTYLIFKQN